MASKATATQANVLWQKQPKANAELFALTYGALVAELVRDVETNQAIQGELDRMGHSIGVRCIEEVLAKAAVKAQSFADTAEVLQLAFRMFLGSSTEIVNPTDTSYSVRFSENPLTMFVELPEDRKDLEYIQLLAGMVRGMLEMLQFETDCQVTASPLQAAAPKDYTQLTVTLKQVLQEGAGEDYQEE